MEEDQARGGVSLESLGAKMDTLASDFKDMNTQLSERLTGVETLVSRVEARLSGVETKLSGVETRLSGVETHLTDVGKQLAKVQITVEGIDAFGQNVWDSLESLRTKVADGFEEARKENGREFKLVHSAIRHLGEKVQRIEDAQARMTNHEP